MTKEVDKLYSIKIQLEGRKDWLEKDIAYAKKVETDEARNVLEKAMWKGSSYSSESELNFINGLLELIKEGEESNV